MTIHFGTKLLDFDEPAITLPMVEQQIAKITDREHGLKRQLTARQMAMVAVGGSIGTGLLLGSGAAIQVAGPAAIISYITAALICP